MPANTLSYVLSFENLLRDKDSGAQTFTNVFDFIFLPADKSEVVQSFYTAGRILNTPGGVTQVQVDIYDPEGKIFQSQNTSGTLQPGDFNFSLNFKLVQFKSVGKYLIKVKVNNIPCNDQDRFYFVAIKRS